DRRAALRETDRRVVLTEARLPESGHELRAGSIDRGLRVVWAGRRLLDLGAPALRPRLRLRAEERQGGLTQGSLALVQSLSAAARGSVRRVVEVHRLIHARLGDALDARRDVVAVVDGVRAGATLEIRTVSDVPSDIGERRLRAVGVGGAAAL